MKLHLIFYINLLLIQLDAQAPDSTTINQVDSLIKVSKALTAKNDFDKALEVNVTAEKIALEKLGKESAAYASTCFNLGRISFFKKDFSKAEIWYLKSKDIREKILGKEHADYITNIRNLAFLYVNMGHYQKAEQLFLEKKMIQEKVFGKAHPSYTSSLMDLANIYFTLGQNEKAESTYLESKAIGEIVLGKEHPDYIGILNNLASLYNTLGLYEKSEPLSLESKSIQEKVHGKESSAYAFSIINLAKISFELGQYERAENLYLETKNIQEKVLGHEHPDYAYNLNSLANLYSKLGQFDKAEQFFLKSKTIREKVFGKEHDYYAESLNDLANLYADMGQYEKSMAYYQELIKITETLFGKEHRKYATSISNLALLYMDIGQCEKSEPLLLTSKSILEKVLGKEDPNFRLNLDHLGYLYLKMGQIKKAEQLFIESKDLFEKTLGNTHPNFAQRLHNLGFLYLNSGQYEKAEPLLLKAKIKNEKALGKEHQYYINGLASLAVLYSDQSQYEKAEPYYQELCTTNQIMISRALLHLSERELNNYMKKFLEYENRILSFAQFSGREKLVSAIFDQALFYKGFLLNSGTQVRRLALSNPNSAETFNKLKECRRRLATLYSKPISERDSAQITRLEVLDNDLEKGLAGKVLGYGEAMQQVKWKEVQTLLRYDEASIEFVHYRFYRNTQSDSTMYAALLLKKNENQPRLIALFEERALDSLLKNRPEHKADYVNNLYSLTDRGAKEAEALKRSLYEIIWQPLEKELVGIKTVYFSPSGLLHRINLDAIPVSETETLADKYQLIELNSTRQLVIRSDVKVLKNDAILFGGIQFEQDTNIQNIEPLLAFRSRGELFFNAVDTTLRGGSWNYLPGTEREVNAIEKIMQTSGVQTNLKKGYAATEESFKNIGANNNPSPRILHIATHGYFFPDSKSTTKKSTLNGEQETVFKISDHPMLRSGLIMARGNAAWKGIQTLEGREDGVLTAYEISQMNLSNTELVVLSACETGLGDIQGNEGVYGLQRAFKIAGAKYLIMSLWQVPDKQTSLLMTTFYKKWLEEKLTIPDAFHAAQKELRDIGLDPYQWAGFVLVE